MAKPNKPTQEELDQKIQEAADIPDDELEKSQEDEEDSEEEPESEEQDENTEVDEESDEEGKEAEATDDEVEDEEQAEPSKELYKKKFSESSRENQKIHAKNRVINQALIEADEIPDPTEEELESEYKDWDLATDIEKISLKEAYISKQWRSKISQAKEQATKIEKWNDSVEEFVGDPKTLIDTPELEGKTDEFRRFAQEAENNSVPFKILVSAFLHDNSINKKTNKGKMFERGKGGSNERPQLKNGKISLEEARILRNKDYPKYKEKLEAGLIDMEV